MLLETVCLFSLQLSLTKHPVIVFITISNTGSETAEGLRQSGLANEGWSTLRELWSLWHVSEPNEPSNHSPAIRMSQGPLVHRAGNEEKKTSHYWTPVFSRLKDRGNKIKTEKQL